MKHLFLSWLLQVLILSPSLAQVKSDREYDELKGSVKELIVKTGHYVETSGVYVEKCCNLLYSKRYDIRGKVEDTKIGDINIIDAPEYSPPNTKQRLDDKGRLKEESLFDPDGNLLGSIIYDYDDKGNKIAATHYSTKEGIYRKEIFTYDTKQNLKEYILYSDDGTPLYIDVYSDYDSHNNWLKKVHWDWETSGGKSYWELFLVTYREIRYH